MRIEKKLFFVLRSSCFSFRGVPGYRGSGEGWGRGGARRQAKRAMMFDLRAGGFIEMIDDKNKDFCCAASGTNTNTNTNS